MDKNDSRIPVHGSRIQRGVKCCFLELSSGTSYFYAFTFRISVRYFLCIPPRSWHSIQREQDQFPAFFSG